MLNTTRQEAKKWLANLTANVEKMNAKNARSAWGRGVGEYTEDLLHNLSEALDDYEAIPTTTAELEKMMLNGADNWQHFSEGGCSLWYDFDIAKRLCNPSELKRTDNGHKNPNSRENWIDCQARALYQASNRIRLAFNGEV